ncbi:TetR/AcrR family transcriptional regulator C-terminal domain-containing protein [Leuconostoc falkenbergense]|uniref:TetR/AcrR family transcriptional regulator n=1 Tax=Leuconostoc falkenbergense TaxID=2766470 RepID=UPI0024AD461D|nr:TetR/AcrR family transcriptional regulator C-terminal domain-containing protein [Leuconostoc falkenbergense]MDI6666725.1 TetR/AcrR family transcriptional regulator C-terminal domain-containing protein [Leuconostoc falkenbergense]
MAIKNDWRFTRSEEKIRVAFKSLLYSNGFKKITVSQIIKLAHINRSTFYDHYPDKYELMADIQIEVIKQITADLPLLTIAMLKDDKLIKSRIMIIVTNISKQRTDLMLYIGEKSDGQFFNRLSKYTASLLLKTDFLGHTTIPNDYAITFLNGVFCNFLETWMIRGFTESPDELADIILKILPQLAVSII